MQSGTPQQNLESLERRTKELQSAYDELKQTQAQLLQSEKLASIGQLAAGVAQEMSWQSRATFRRRKSKPSKRSSNNNRCWRNCLYPNVAENGKIRCG